MWYRLGKLPPQCSEQSKGGSEQNSREHHADTRARLDRPSQGEDDEQIDRASSRKSTLSAKSDTVLMDRAIATSTPKYARLRSATIRTGRRRPATVSRVLSIPFCPFCIDGECKLIPGGERRGIPSALASERDWLALPSQRAILRQSGGNFVRLRGRDGAVERDDRDRVD